MKKYVENYWIAISIVIKMIRYSLIVNDFQSLMILVLNSLYIRHCRCQILITDVIVAGEFLNMIETRKTKYRNDSY